MMGPHKIFGPRALCNLNPAFALTASSTLCNLNLITIVSVVSPVCHCTKLKSQ